MSTQTLGSTDTQTPAAQASTDMQTPAAQASTDVQTPAAQTPAPGASALPGEGLRERKKRMMREQLSETATAMFLERGFDAVRVAEVAAACEVSEKTVFNYFPTKEALVLDRLEATMASLRTGLADPQIPPVQAALRILDRELSGMTAMLAGHDDPGRAAHAMRRFGDLIRTTPSLRAYQSDMMGQFVSVAAEVLATRAGMSPDDPEPQIAAQALLGLWRVQAESLRKHLDGAPAPARVRELVTADVRRAARLIDSGLRSFATRGEDGADLQHLAAVSAGGPVPSAPGPCG